MKRKNTISADNIQILGHSFEGFDVTPSANIFYRVYPYKVKFDFLSSSKKTKTTVNRYISAVQLCLSAVDFRAGQRTGAKKSCMSLYVKSVDDIKVLIVLFGESIVDISGPVSDQHLETLLDTRFKREIRKSLWFNQYNCKVFVMIPHHAWRQGDSINNVIDDISQQITIRVDEKLYRYKQDLWTDFYCDFDEFAMILPFIKISNPSSVFRATKCILK
jgi:hypothetical protein